MASRHNLPLAALACPQTGHSVGSVVPSPRKHSVHNRPVHKWPKVFSWLPLLIDCYRRKNTIDYPNGMVALNPNRFNPCSSMLLTFMGKMILRYPKIPWMRSNYASQSMQNHAKPCKAHTCPRSVNKQLSAIFCTCKSQKPSKAVCFSS